MNRFRFVGRLALAAVTAASAALVVSAQASLDPNVIKQIKDIYSFKASLTPAEAKLSTNLLLLSRQANGTLPANMQRYLPADAKRDTAGKLAVVVHGFKTSNFMESAAKAGVRMTDGATPNTVARSGRYHAHVTEAELLKLAQQSDVTLIREAGFKHTNAGSVTSQGYVAMGANKVVPTGVTGAGIKVGVLSDSALPAQVSSLIASGDLPADVTVLPGQAGPTSGENEGTAMMEIIHDLAPDAKLFFATAFDGEDSFAQNIRDLRNVYGCDIIVDDVSYSDEAAFQDGEIAQAVNDVTASGALYFSSAANSGNLSSGTSGTWEGDFVNGGTSGAPITTYEGKAVALHNFSTTGTQNYDVLTGSTTDIVLHWSDPLGASSNDYDLFLLNSGGTSVTTFSTNSQTGTQDPIEELYTGNTFAAGSRVVVAQYSGTTRAMHIDTERGRLGIATSGATLGHNAGASTFSAAAVYWQAAHKGVVAFTGGPTNPVETFSSDGPRKIFYNPDGTPITPGNFLFATGGGQTLIKPDAAGADGVVTRTAGFNPFFGTSAAAPHLAAVAALIKSANPTLTNTQIRTIMTNTALDNMAAGVDRDSGFGIVSAPAAVAAAKAAK